jgi:hypothetical protein
MVMTHERDASRGSSGAGAQTGSRARILPWTRMATPSSPRHGVRCHAVRRNPRIPDLFERNTTSLSEFHSTGPSEELAIPHGFRPRDSAAAGRAAHPQLCRKPAQTSARRSGADTRSSTGITGRQRYSEPLRLCRAPRCLHQSPVGLPGYPVLHVMSVSMPRRSSCEKFAALEPVAR